MILGIAGAKHSGKNTVAKFLTERYANSFQVREWSFAEDLKIGATASLGVHDDPIEFCDWLKEKAVIEVYEAGRNPRAFLTGREFLQYYGTEAHRNVFGTDFWVDNLMAKIKDVSDGTAWEERLDLITDVRFPNEAIAIQEAAGRVLRVRRSEVENVGDGHASEKPLADELVDREITNEAGLAELEWNAYSAAQMYLAPIIGNRVKYA